MGVTDVVGAGKLGEDTAVVDQTPHRDAAEADAVITALPADQPRPRALADGALIGDGDLQRRVDGLRSGSGEEYPVEAGLRSAGSHGRKAFSKFEGDRMSHLERRRIVQFGQLAANRIGDAQPAVSGVDAPQAGGPVEHPPVVGAAVIHAIGGDQQPRRRLELAVGRERHPIAVERREIAVGGHRALLVFPEEGPWSIFRYNPFSTDL